MSTRRAHPSSLPFTNASGALPWVGVAAAAAFIGAAISGETDRFLGTLPSLALIAAIGGAAVVVILASLGFRALLAWPILTGLAYPFLVFPSDDPLATFDRLWLFGLIGVLGVTPRVVRASRETRYLVGAVGVLTLVYGVRTLTTTGASLGSAKLWIDAILLPTILFVATTHLAPTHVQTRKVALSMSVGGAMLALLGMTAVVFGLDLASYSGGQLRVETGLDTVRISGPYPVPEPYALSLVICLAATCYWVLTSRGSSQFLGIVIGAAELGAIGMTLFRAAWIAAILVLICAFGLRARRLGRLLFVTAILAALLFGATTQLRDSSLFAERVDNTDNIYGRLATYVQGIDIFRSAPIFGVGVDRYHVVAGSLPPTFVNDVASVTYPHSSFVGILAEQGIVGFGAFLAVCIAAWRVIRRLTQRAFDRESAALAGVTAGAALGYLAMSLTLTMLPYGPSNAFFAMLLGLAAGRLLPVTASVEQSQ